MRPLGCVAMSDDTPTQPYDPMRDDAPTERYEVAGGAAAGGPPAGGAGLDPAFAAAPATAAAPAPATDERRSRRLLVVLLAVGGALLIAIIVVLGLTLGRGDDPVVAGTDSPAPTDTPVATDTPTPTPTVTATTEPAPPPAPAPAPGDGNVRITGYVISPQNVDCSDPSKAELEIDWTSADGQRAYFGVNTADAQTSGMGWDLPASGTDADFPDGYRPFLYNCASASQNYTITVVASGSKASQTITVTRQ